MMNQFCCVGRLVSDPEKQTSENTGFSRCKHSVLDYMSLKNPTKDQIKRLIDRIEIDKDKKIYVHLKFPELLEQV